MEQRHDKDVRFVLNPYVVRVAGARRAALYDLHRKRIFPIPASAAYVLDLCRAETVDAAMARIEDAGDREIARGYLAQFAELGFGGFAATAPLRELPYRVDRAPHRIERLQWLSVEWREGDDTLDRDAWAGILRAARADGPAHQLTVFLGEGDALPGWTSAALSGLPALQFHHVEVVLPATGADAEVESAIVAHGFRACVLRQEAAEAASRTLSRLHALGARARLSRVPEHASVTEATLLCDHQTYTRLRNGSTHAGSLHLDATGAAFPWALERTHRIDRVRDGDSLRALLRSEALRRAWAHGKDAIAVCRDCEFRYACQNSYSFRRDPDDIASAPSNCLYDPYTGEWAYSREDPCFGGAMRVDVQRSRHFDVHSTSERPLAPEWLDELDRAVDDVVEAIGLQPPKARMRYRFYPSMAALQRALAHHGTALSGITEIKHGDGDCVIRTAYPCHIHEIVHALLHQLNKTPKFFVSEACATMFGRARGLRRDNDGGDFDAGGQYQIRGGAQGGLRLDDVLAFDENGLVLGRAGAADVHAIARGMLDAPGAALRISHFYDAVDERDLPGYFYEFGGSFFLWLLQSRGAETFRAFYASGQRRGHIEAFYGRPLEELAGLWADAITAQ